jgi:hypothetical protein
LLSRELAAAAKARNVSLGGQSGRGSRGKRGGAAGRYDGRYDGDGSNAAKKSKRPGGDFKKSYTCYECYGNSTVAWIFRYYSVTLHS